MPAFDDIPLIDNHLHPPLKADAAAARRPFAAFFTEAADVEMIADHVPHTHFYRRALRDLAALLGCEANEEAVVAARAALGPAGLLRRCVARGNVAKLVVDDGYPTGPEAFSVGDMVEAAGCGAGRVLRLESLVGELVAAHEDLRNFDDMLWLTLEQAWKFGAAAIKSAVAYRCGLAFRRPSLAEAAVGLRVERERASGAAPRVTDPRLLFHALAVAVNFATERELPLQIHTGFGDRDLDLVQANPALLRPLLEDAPLASGCQIVLLHAGYPYVREAGFLAAMYPRVYVDWSLANPLLPARVLTRVLEELLALAPATKLLYGSDAWGVPDWIYLGARYGREALAAALVDDPDAAAIARRILHDNAAELYPLA